MNFSLDATLYRKNTSVNPPPLDTPLPRIVNLNDPDHLDARWAQSLVFSHYQLFVKELTRYSLSDVL